MRICLPDILPPTARRIPGRPKKNRRNEQGEAAVGVTLGKKRILMRCNKCIFYGHNKITCRSSDEEINERQREAAEAKKAQSEAARAQAAAKVRF